MRVFHGSYVAIEEVNLELAKSGKDFGRGFYVTKFRSQAEYWSKRKGKEEGTEGVVTEFDFHGCAYIEEELKVLRFDDYSEKWFDFIMLNRANEQKEQAHDYDIVEGPVADDAVTRRISDYLRGDISREQFLQELKFKKPTHQICFCTVQALLMLTFVNDGADGKIIHTDDDVVETLMENFGWTEEQATYKYYLSETYTKFADESTGLYQKPWNEIYELLLQELNLKK